MAKQLITTSELAGTRVVGGKNGTKRIGKVRSFVFHPKEKRCIGFIVKRPDLLWMFRRKDKFVSIDGYDIEDGRIVIRNVPEATDRAACKSLGVNWDDCVLWMGLPVMTQDGQDLGLVGSVTFNRLTGTVDSLETNSGATSNALLGKRTIPASMVAGFKRGMGAERTTKWSWVPSWWLTRPSTFPWRAAWPKKPARRRRWRSIRRIRPSTR